MTEPAAGPLVGAPSRSLRPDRRLVLRSRIATVGLVVVLLAVTVFALVTSQVTARAAERAESASLVADAYARAATAVAAEESLERKYRLEPAPEVRVRYDETAAELTDALRDVDRDGGADDQALARLVLQSHASYLGAIDRLFAAVDAHTAGEITRIDGDQVDPSFEAIEMAVDQAADAHHRESLQQIARLQRLESLTGQLTPVVFLLGLLLAGLLSSVTRGYRRLLAEQHGRAVHDSLHDALTGLPNRRLLADRVGEALRDGPRTGQPVALLLIDLDRFKEVNDTFGHHHGDQLIQQVGQRLIAALREGDTVARLGGDEFAVLLPEVADVDDASAAAAELRAVLETSFLVEGVALDVEASVGIALAEPDHDAATLLQRADVAMYVAKEQHLGVCVYDPALDGHSPARLALLGDLRRAIDGGQLVLHYQPKVAVDGGEVVGAEALVRWQHPERGLLFPDAFVPLAEHTSLIGPLTTHVLDLALAQARRWREAGRPTLVSVNLSARNLLDPRLPAQVAGLLAVHHVPAELLELEVTESAIMVEPARARRLLAALGELGVRISLDDFGAGYTSLGQLRTLPITELKIDKSFVLAMAADAGNQLIVSSVVDLGHNLGLTIVAEGVEDAETLAMLRGFGCDVAQGYHLARPAPVEQFDAWWAQRHAPVPAPAQRRSDEADALALPPR